MLSQSTEDVASDYKLFHLRPECPTENFKTGPHSKVCQNCICYICDTQAVNCKSWSSHCHANPNDQNTAGHWIQMKMLLRADKQLNSGDPSTKPPQTQSQEKISEYSYASDFSSNGTDAPSGPGSEFLKLLSLLEQNAPSAGMIPIPPAKSTRWESGNSLYLMSDVALLQSQLKSEYQPVEWTYSEDNVHIKNILSVLRGEEFEVPALCEAEGCRYEFRRQKKRDALAYLNHAKERHRATFIDCQWVRVKCGEIPIPSDVVPGDYLREIMQFIGDKQMFVGTCLVPGCPRTGKDRNIMSGHFRETHPRTYKYCQLVSDEYDTENIRRIIDQYLARVENKKKRKYVYK